MVIHDEERAGHLWIDKAKQVSEHLGNLLANAPLEAKFNCHNFLKKAKQTP